MNAPAPGYPEDPHEVAPPLPRIRVVVIGGTTLFRAGLRSILEQEEEIEIIGEGDTLAQWSQHVGGPPDIMLLDTLNFTGAVPDMLEEIRERSASMRVLIVTSHGDPDAVRRSVIAGASGAIFKDAPIDHLLTAIRKVHAGELWVDRSMTAQIIASMVSGRHREIADPEYPRIASLTLRERQVIALIACGLSNKAVGARMNISGSTVRHHLRVR